MTVINDEDNSQVQQESSGVDGAEHKENMFSQENIGSDTIVKSDAEDTPSNDDSNKNLKEIVITPEDKKSFIDSVVSNSRFEKDYSLFGGNLKVTIRSVTAEETNALAAWAFKKSVSDPTWYLSGRGRRYILVAQVAKFNGTSIPPMATPLFETLQSDGHTIKEPGWLASCAFWDGKSAAVVDAIIKCIADFEKIYSTLCSKADDVNFWSPDTP